MKRFIIFALLIVVTNVFGQNFITPAAHGASPDAVSGIVFFDTDGDGIQSPTEASAANAVVNIQEVGSDLISSMIADDFGYFNTGEMTYGIYHVWTENNGVSSEVTTIEISEINGTAVVNLPIMPDFSIMLPFISN